MNLPVGSPPPPKLLDHLRAEIRLRHYSIHTEEAYVDWARRYILFHDKRHPKDMGADQVTAFLTHLATGTRFGTGLVFAPPHPYRNALRGQDQGTHRATALNRLKGPFGSDTFALLCSATEQMSPNTYCY